MYYKGKQYLQQEIERLIRTRLMRKKYLYQAALREQKFLTQFYRDKEDARGRKIAFKVEELNSLMVEMLLDKYVTMKACEYKIIQYEYSIQCMVE